MAVDPSTLLAPEGPVEPDMFPGEGVSTELLARLTEYVQQGTAKASAYTFTPTSKADDAAKAWALYLTFRAAWTLALARPAADDMDAAVLGSVSFAKDQREGLKELSEMYFSEYSGLIAETGATAAASTGLPSHSVDNEFDW